MSWLSRATGPRWLIGSAVAGVVGALAYLAQIVVGFEIPLAWRIILTTSGTVLLFFSVVLPNWQARHELRAHKAALVTVKEAVAEYDVKVHKILIPLSSLLATVIGTTNARERQLAQERMKQAVVDYALDNVQGAEPRSCFFAYKDTPKRKLVLQNPWRGRNSQPRSEFVEGYPAGDEVLKILDQKRTRFVPDADKDQPPGWPGSAQRGYNTYIQVAVANGEQSFGILAVDALNAGDLTQTDKRLIELLAQLLGCALAA